MHNKTTLTYSVHMQLRLDRFFYKNFRWIIFRKTIQPFLMFYKWLQSCCNV